MGNKALGFTMDQENTIWEMWRRGDSLSATGRVLGGESVPQIGRFLRKSGGIRPLPRRRRASRLTAGGEREEISRGIAAGDSARTIADKLGRSPSTIAREIARNGGREHYRATPGGCRSVCPRAPPSNLDSLYQAFSAGGCHREAE